MGSYNLSLVLPLFRGFLVLRLVVLGVSRVLGMVAFLVVLRALFIVIFSTRFVWKVISVAVLLIQHLQLWEPIYKHRLHIKHPFAVIGQLGYRVLA
jgi:hypothetical protein